MTETLTLDLPQLAKVLNLKPSQVEATVELLDAENTIPFITRYRKERTGGLDEQQLRAVQKAVESRRQFIDRAETILRLVGEQGALTPELKRQMLAAPTLKHLEDLYLPFRPKRRTRAAIAKERGLEPLADSIWQQDDAIGDVRTAASEYVSDERELPDVDAVLSGVQDILAERIGDEPSLRNRCRRIAGNSGRLVVSSTPLGRKEGTDFQDYFDFSESLKSLPPHRVLAINRGEQQKYLRVKFDWDEDRAFTEGSIFLRTSAHRFRKTMEESLRDAIARLIGPGLARELRRETNQEAEQHAVDVFAKNLRSLLLQPPLMGERVLAIDPGFRTGCKVAVLDESGRLLAHDVISVLTEAGRGAGMETLQKLLAEHETQRIAIGNGTGCRETEELVSQLIAEKCPDVRYAIVNEAGASIYSASPVGQQEFPDLDATVRGTVSIGRRLQDPLSELVKIDPEHIGVGMYQHDVDPKRLRSSLDEVVESCVNFVGVNLNVASVPLLSHVAGFNQLTARRVVAHRNDNGPFRTRDELLNVSGIGPKTFMQAAGFLKIEDGSEPLDRTNIHPESYPVARQILSRVGIDPAILSTSATDAAAKRQQLGGLDAGELATELDVGRPTISDILADLNRPGRDPRGELAEPVFKSGVLTLDDLSPGMKLQGTVLNVVDFGAFVDLGVKHAGLIHISQLADGFVRDPHEHVSVGDVLTVWVLSIDRDRQRIALSRRPPE